MLFVLLTLIEAIAFGLIPLVSDLWSVYLMAFLIYFGVAVIERGSYTWIISMWKSSSRAVLRLSTAMFHLGIVIGPILDIPFVLGDVTVRDQGRQLDPTLEYNKPTAFTDELIWDGKFVYWGLSCIISNKNRCIDLRSQINDILNRRPKLMMPFLIGSAICSISEQKINLMKINLIIVES